MKNKRSEDCRSDAGLKSKIEFRYMLCGELWGFKDGKPVGPIVTMVSGYAPACARIDATVEKLQQELAKERKMARDRKLNKRLTANKTEL